jgi:hypothetical protein
MSKPVVACGQLNGFEADQAAVVVVLHVGQVVVLVLQEIAHPAGKG